MENLKNGNKGEWGELYAFFYALAHGKLEDKKGNSLTIVKLRRSGKDYIVKESYDLFDEIADLKNDLPRLFREISQGRSSFSCPRMSYWMDKLNITQIKSCADNKDDFSIQFKDQAMLGYNVKALFAGSPGIINASKKTNFVYKVNCDCSDNDLNALKKPKKIISNIYKNGGTLEFWKSCEQFEENLIRPEIYAMLVLEYFKSDKKFISDLINQIFEEEEKVLGMKKSGWRRIISKALVDFGNDLTPSKKPKETKNDASGGLVFVKKDGSVICDKYSTKNDASDYLYKKTFLDTGSTRRHNFGKIYYENGIRVINLNLNIKESIDD